MPAEPLSEQQIEFLENELNEWRRLGMSRPPKTQSLTASIRVSKLGREVSSQEVGRCVVASYPSYLAHPKQMVFQPHQRRTRRAPSNQENTRTDQRA